MSEENAPFFSVSVKNHDEVTRLTERLYEVTEPGAVFSKPTKSGEYTLITASEVTIGLGSGYGFGEKTQGQPDNAGGGGGGGGMAAGRPVAVVSVGPEGVQVHPILDRTKLGIALFSAVGSMLMAMARSKK
ncbi:MAG: spore germination protein GerW family protein [Anaerolineales bacterium]